MCSDEESRQKAMAACQILIDTNDVFGTCLSVVSKRLNLRKKTDEFARSMVLNITVLVSLIIASLQPIIPNKFKKHCVNPTVLLLVNVQIIISMLIGVHHLDVVRIERVSIR